MQESSALGNFYQPGSSAVSLDCQKYLKDTAESYGYTWPKKVQDNMYIVNTFEKKFDGDIWTQLSDEVTSKMAGSVVAIASFSGGRRVFACTGVFIEHGECYQRILTSASLVRAFDDQAVLHAELRIEVGLINKRCAIGELVYHDFEYNIALVEIKESVRHPVIELQKHTSVTIDTTVVAVGCLFNECRLMATEGVVTGKGCTMECKQLQMSTCKITKAGIGGPLIDTSGNFVGMNFYGDEGTPFLPASTLVKILKNHDRKRPDAANIAYTGQNRWPVPVPDWCYPELTEPVLEDMPEWCYPELTEPVLEDTMPVYD